MTPKKRWCTFTRELGMLIRYRASLDKILLVPFLTIHTLFGWASRKKQVQKQDICNPITIFTNKHIFIARNTNSWSLVSEYLCQFSTLPFRSSNMYRGNKSLNPYLRQFYGSWFSILQHQRLNYRHFSFFQLQVLTIASLPPSTTSHIYKSIIKKSKCTNLLVK